MSNLDNDFEALLKTLSGELPPPRTLFEKNFNEALDNFEGDLDMNDLSFFATVLNELEKLEPVQHYLRSSLEANGEPFYAKHFSVSTINVFALMKYAPEWELPEEARKQFENFSITSKNVHNMLELSGVSDVSRILLRALEKTMIEEEAAA